MDKKPLIRQCISCRTQLPRDNFIRLTKAFDSVTSSEKILISPDKFHFGRSAYVCKSINCINIAMKEKKIAKMLRASVKSLENILPQLLATRHQLQALNGEVQKV